MREANCENAMPNIVGNLSLKKRLCKDVLSASLSHAYIIEGEQGSGRSSIALFTAAATACERKNEGVIPCSLCPSCKKILEGKSPDVIFVNSNGKSSLGVDAARFIKEDVFITPNDLEDKFYIIEDADKMTIQAQNAILLTLEEPPHFVHFFLLCENSVSLLETIRSRAPTLRTQPIEEEDIDRYICTNDPRAKELKERSQEEYSALLRASGGSIGKALELLDAKAWNTLKEKREFAKRLLRAALKRSSDAEMLALLSLFSSKREIFSEQLSILSDGLRDLLMLKKSEDVRLCFFSDKNEATELADSTSSAFLISLQAAISTAIEENKRNGNIRLIYTKLAINAKLL